jgi:uncharacterized membrane protein
VPPDPQGRPGHAALAWVIERNIETIAALRERGLRERSASDRIADAITAFSGRMLFIYAHVVWFGGWILVNTGRFGIKPFDAYPYGLLTMIVSLEAIFLATFVLITQNRMAEESERRADLALHMGILTEHELTRALHMLDALHQKLGIEGDQDPELTELEQETLPEDVLARIDKIRRRMGTR